MALTKQELENHAEWVSMGVDLYQEAKRIALEQGLDLAEAKALALAMMQANLTAGWVKVLMVGVVRGA